MSAEIVAEIVAQWDAGWSCRVNGVSQRGGGGLLMAVTGARNGSEHPRNRTAQSLINSQRRVQSSHRLAAPHGNMLNYLSR